MTTARVWTIGAVVAVVAILGAAFALGIQPRLSAAAAARSAATAADTQNATTRIELARLSRLAAKEADLHVIEADLEAAVPGTLKPNTLSRMLRNTAALDGVSVVAFVPSEPTVYAPTVTDGSAPAPAASSGSSATPSPSPSATPGVAATPADPKSPWFGKTDPAISAANFTVVPLSVSVRGGADAVTAFASDAQAIDRLFAVSTFSTDLDKTTGLTTGVLSGYVYTLQR